jgi:hypothetical protein
MTCFCCNRLNIKRLKKTNNFKIFRSKKTKELKQDRQNLLRLLMPKGDESELILVLIIIAYLGTVNFNLNIRFNSLFN